MTATSSYLSCISRLRFYTCLVVCCLISDPQWENHDEPGILPVTWGEEGIHMTDDAGSVIDGSLLRNKLRRLTVKRYGLGAQLLGGLKVQLTVLILNPLEAVIVATDLLVNPFQILSSGVISSLTLPVSSLLFEFYFALCRVAFAAVPMRGDGHLRRSPPPPPPPHRQTRQIWAHRTGRLVLNPMEISNLEFTT
jgi:hypothetical protein